MVVVVPSALMMVGLGRDIVGMRVMVVGMAVIIPGFLSIQAAQIPVK